MKNKKLILTISVISFVLIVSFVITYNLSKNTNNYLAESKSKNSVNNSFLTLMLEQSDGTYLESTSNTWPGDGYIFNSELSACENGGELDFDSENNKVILYSNKSDGCYVYFDIYNKPIINSINLSEVTNNTITINVTTTEGTNPISNYYYIINDGVPVSTTNNTYTFSGLDSNTTYTIKVYVVDTLGYSSEVSNLNVETEEPILLADWVINEYNGTQGNNGIYYHTSSLANSAGDNSYRYAGANPNNYVCFGSDAETCPEDNLYRIIGVFDGEIKLIKATSYGTIIWDSGNNNDWSTSDIKNSLNTTYLNNFEISWQNLITNHNWQIGGMGIYTGTAKEIYDIELGVNSTYEADNTKIGLMYVSDYGFAAGNNYWTTDLRYYNSNDNNWMFLSEGVSEWTITKYNIRTIEVYIISTGGAVYPGETFGTNRLWLARPCFYLTSDVAYSSGSGTQSDPIRIVV